METLSFFYQRVGPSGVALVILALLVIYFAVKTLIIFWLTGKNFNRTAMAINANVSDPDTVIANNLENPIVAIINEVIKTHGNHSDDIKAEVAYLFNLHFSKVMRDLTFIRVIGAISPMVGLLGTLLGLLGVFNSLAASTASSTSNMLAAGIWEAILTTVMGITLAVPAIIIYHLLRLKLKTFHLATVEYSYRLFDRKNNCAPPAANVATMRRKEAAL